MPINTFTLEVPAAGYNEAITLETPECACKKSKPAKSFKQLVELVKQAEENLIENGYDDVGNRINIIRGIYYGTNWSLDFKNEGSGERNFAFNSYTWSSVVADAREELKCSEECKADLFNSLYNSFEVFDSKYKAVDFGHLIIGLDSRRSWSSKTIPFPTQGGTGLELNTWAGDLSGGAAKLSLDRVSNPNKRATSMFPTFGSSYGAMVNLEGDIAAYVVGMNEDEESTISDATDSFDTIHEALEDYFACKWDNRAYYFLRMLDGKFENGVLVNKAELVKYCAEVLEDFAYWYLGIRDSFDAMKKASGNFKAASEEMAAIFIDGLLHVVKKPKDMITKRTNPDPKPKEETTLDKASEVYENIINWFE